MTNAKANAFEVSLRRDGVVLRQVTFVGVVFVFNIYTSQLSLAVSPRLCAMMDTATGSNSNQI